MLQASETCSEWDEQLCTDPSQKVATVFRTQQSDNYVLTTWCLGIQQTSPWDVRSIQFASARVACGAALVMEVSSCPLRPPLTPDSLLVTLLLPLLYWFGCLKVPSSGQQAFLGQWSLPKSMLACAARLESPVVRVKRRRTSIFLPMNASCHGQRCAAVTGLHLIQTLHTAEVTLPISQQLH